MHRVYSGSAEYVNLCSFDQAADFLLLQCRDLLLDASQREMWRKGALVRFVAEPARCGLDPALQRPVDVPALVGSNAKLRAATGWAPTKSRSDIITDIFASLDAAS